MWVSILSENNEACMDDNERQMSLLVTFHYVVGGVGALFACLPLLHLLFGIAMLTGIFPGGQEENAPPVFVGIMFAVIGGFFFLFGQAVSWCIIYSGFQLKKKRKYLFSFIIACVMCIFIPFGTILGIFTIIVLSKEPVKMMYDKML